MQWALLKTRDETSVVTVVAKVIVDPLNIKMRGSVAQSSLTGMEEMLWAQGVEADHIL